MNTLVLIVDIAIAVTLAEALLLTAWFCARRRGLAPQQALANIAAGLCLMAALRGVLADAAPAWTVLCLVLAGAAHATDMLWRWRHEVPAR